MAAGAAFLALAVVLVLIVVNSSGRGGDAKNIGGKPDVDRLLAGIPQQKMVLGDPKGPVTLIEFGDLQCPVCAGFAKEILPPIIENQVKNGEPQIDFRNLTIIGDESIPAGAAALAAGEQGRGWNYLELFYRNQGDDRSGDGRPPLAQRPDDRRHLRQAACLYLAELEVGGPDRRDGVAVAAAAVG